eukprot:Selendium_serpulae@DN5964_c1_g1_i14.p2
MLKAAKRLAEVLLVAVYDDATVSSMKGAGFPIVNTLERCLTVLAMRSVDGLLVGAPRSLSDEQARRMGVTHVVTHNEVDNIRLEEETQSEAAKQSWRRCNLEAATTLTTAEILRRIAHRRSLLAATIDSRVMKENSYYEERLTNMKND